MDETKNTFPKELLNKKGHSGNSCNTSAVPLWMKGTSTGQNMVLCLALNLVKVSDNLGKIWQATQECRSRRLDFNDVIM